MGEFRFDNVRLLLADSNPQVRNALKGALFHAGFRDILDAGAFATVRDAVERNAVDVVVTEVDIAGGDVCAMINQLRHHKVGNNPFLIVLMMTGAPTEQNVRRIIDSGADDLVLKPVSPDALLGRLKTLARGRKPFVVTHDYIGPDRRKQARPEGQQLPLLDVPNPLRSKAVANSDAASLQRMIDAAAARINQEKMTRYAVQIGYLTDRIVPHFAEGRLKVRDRGVVADIEAHLRRLGYIAEDLGYRMRGTSFAHVAELALSLIGIAKRILEGIHSPAERQAGSMIDHRDVDLLPKVAQALGRAFSSDQQTVAAAHQISESVQNFAGRPGRPAN